MSPATAGEQRTRIVHRSWGVELNESGKHEPLQAGATFKHCPGDIVTDIRLTAKMVHPSRRRIDYWVGERHRGEDTGYVFYTSTGRHGRVVANDGREGGQGMGNGRWTFLFRRPDSAGRPMGRSSIKLATADGPGC